MKILVSDNLSESGIEKLMRVPGFDVEVNTTLKPEEFRLVIKEFDALVIRSGTKVTADVLENAPNLKVIWPSGDRAGQCRYRSSQQARHCGYEYSGGKRNNDRGTCDRHDACAYAQHPAGFRFTQGR